RRRGRGRRGLGRRVGRVASLGALAVVGDAALEDRAIRRVRRALEVGLERVGGLAVEAEPLLRRADVEQELRAVAQRVRLRELLERALVRALLEVRAPRLEVEPRAFVVLGRSRRAQKRER